jgi:hypothetical protein
VKHKLAQPMLEVLFQLMSVRPENDDSEEYFTEDTDASTPMTCATETLDILALHLPPDKLLPPLVCCITFAIVGNENRIAVSCPIHLYGYRLQVVMCSEMNVLSHKCSQNTS